MNNITNPADLKAGNRYRVTYDVTAKEGPRTYEGVAATFGADLTLKTDKDGLHRSLTVVDGTQIEPIITSIEPIGPADTEGAPTDDLTHEEPVAARVHRAAIDEIRQLRDAHRCEADRAVTAEDELSAFKSQVSEFLVELAEERNIDDGPLEDWHEELGLEMPKPEPVTVEYTITVTARVTPADREIAKTLESGDPSMLLEDALNGLDSLDFDPDTFEVDPYAGFNVEIDHVEAY